VFCGKKPSFQTGLWAGTDSRRMLSVSLAGQYFTTQLKDGVGVAGAVQFNPLSNLQFELIPGFRLSKGDVRWIETQNEGTADERFAFGEQHSEYLDLTFRSTVTFNTELTLQAYAQMFLAAVDYGQKYYGLARKNRLFLYDLAATDLITDDFDYTASDLNLGLVLRWEYLPGSVAYLVYTGAFGAFDDSGASFDYGGNMADLFGADARHILMLKISYMWS